MAAPLGRAEADALLAELGFAPTDSTELKVEALRTAHGKLAALVARLEASNKSIQAYLDEDPTDKDLAEAVSENEAIMAARKVTMEHVETVLAALGESALPASAAAAGAAAAPAAAVTKPAAPAAAEAAPAAAGPAEGSARSPEDEAKDLGVFL
ncbi:hypothetical protein FNF29_00012 [Cafeteria roenbergensis]|uniref:Uncharacterized protein n=1 Tax=Cafeteria roenbergensis TaxID=33653 RepID=A0A5A8CWQ2_CAFRO|nr:hypothetical protein FNF29_00012 [Cafeteria roenbergensis]|eukprot:KAA0157436.1 hypothetical protein FNF29_00012 [Cafeteria roenbergensis]